MCDFLFLFNFLANQMIANAQNTLMTTLIRFRGVQNNNDMSFI